MPMIKTVVLSILAALTLAACNEKPQTIHQSTERAENRDQSALVDGQRQRTLGQNEAGRIYNEGNLR